MKLTAAAFPYSSIVGGGVMLLSPTGAAMFQIGLRGTTAGISKAQTEAISARLVELINIHGLDVEQLSVDHRPDWKQDHAETSRLPQLGVTPDNFDKLLSDVLADMNADDEAAAAVTTQKNDSF